MSDIRDCNLFSTGMEKIQWVSARMPVLQKIQQEFTETQCLKGVNITTSVHLEAKTAFLGCVLKSGGAHVTMTGCNPLSTQDDVAAALVKMGISVYGWHGATEKEYDHHIDCALETNPNVIIDDGGDLISAIHGHKNHLITDIYGGCEETTTGIHRLKARKEKGQLLFPMINVNDAYCKYLFDNRYGTGQSVWDGINRTTNLIVAGKNVVVAGYGWCGKGISLRAKGLGAKVYVCEIDPIKAMEAVMDGFRVLPMKQAAKLGDLFITATGCEDVITKEHFSLMKDGAIMCNAGHFDCEINVKQLKEESTQVYNARKNIQGYSMSDNKTLFVIAEGRLVNLAAGDGHPAEIMDLSFALQALSVKYIVENHANMENDVYNVPQEIDQRVADLRLEAWGITIDQLTKHQQEYLRGF